MVEAINSELEQMDMEEVIEHKPAFKVYMQEVSKIPDITGDEMERLIKMLDKQETKQKAIDRLVEGNLKLVVAIAHKWKNLGVALEDLVAEGNLKLVEIAGRYDSSIGKSFATFAQWSLNSAMRQTINASKMVRTPIATEANKRKYDTAVSEFEKAYGRTPTEQEIEAITGMSKIVQNNVKSIDNVTISMNQKVDNSDGDSVEIGDMIAQNGEDSVVEKIQHIEDIEVAKKALSMLDQRQRDILEMRLGFRGHVYTLDEVSAVIGKTKERCRQLEKEATKCLIANYKKFTE